MEALFGFVLGYIFGAFPTGYFLGRLYGVDVRKFGSGRTGGSNVLRTIGWPAFILTVGGDAIKGALPVILMMHWLAVGSSFAAAATVIGALLGNNWSLLIAWLGRDDPNYKAPKNPVDLIKSLFARTKGGAGVITTASAALALYWPPVVPLAILGVAVLVIGRYSSIASITVATLYPFVMAYFVLTGAAPAIYLPMSLIVGAVVVYVLIPNIKRLRAGTEQKFGQRLAIK